MSDVIIIGGGPAGATLGCYLSLAGISNIIIEKANHPRPHVGESLVTNTTRIFGEIGFLPVMEKEGFVHKYGATWHSPVGHGSFSIVFSDFPLDGVNQPYSYHIERGKFDTLLLKHAEQLGSTVYQGVPVSRVLFNDKDTACGVQVKLGGQSVDIKGKIVVDASGRGTLMGRQLQIKKKDALFNQYAIHGWFENVNRGPEETAEYIHIYFLPVERGWVWQIPISDTVTSMGVVTEKEQFKSSKLNLESYFEKHIDMSESLKQAMSNVRQVREFEVEGDYSYSMSNFVGNGWLLIGDAARFVDPIFSSGISVAMHSAKFASEAIIAALQAKDVGIHMLMPYENRLRTGVEIWYEFIRLYYKLLPVFTIFIQKPQYRLQVHRLLQGEVFDRQEAPVLQAMRDYIAMVEKSENHLFKQQLLNIPLDDLHDLDLTQAVLPSE